MRKILPVIGLLVLSAVCFAIAFAGFSELKRRHEVAELNAVNHQIGELDAQRSDFHYSVKRP